MLTVPFFHCHLATWLTEPEVSLWLGNLLPLSEGEFAFLLVMTCLPSCSSSFLSCWQGADPHRPAGQLASVGFGQWGVLVGTRELSKEKGETSLTRMVSPGAAGLLRRSRPHGRSFQQMTLALGNLSPPSDLGLGMAVVSCSC